MTSVEERMRRALGLTSGRDGRSAAAQPESPHAAPPRHSAGRSASDKPRHRFVQDGAVPVTLVNRHRPDEANAPPASRGAVVTALQDERAARGRAERSLQETLATVHDLQTKLGHAELAHREAAEAAKTASEAAQAAHAAMDRLRAEHQEREDRWQQDLVDERAARSVAEAALAETVRAHEQAEQARPPAPGRKPALRELQDAMTAPAAKPPAKTAAKRTRKAASKPKEREPQPVKWWLKSAKKR